MGERGREEPVAVVVEDIVEPVLPGPGHRGLFSVAPMRGSTTAVQASIVAIERGEENGGRGGSATVPLLRTNSACRCCLTRPLGRDRARHGHPHRGTLARWRAGRQSVESGSCWVPWLTPIGERVGDVPRLPQGFFRSNR